MHTSVCSSVAVSKSVNFSSHGVYPLKSVGSTLCGVYSGATHMKPEIAVLLHNVRSTHNVGSIFRTADAAGVSHVYLSGYTPTPIDRFGRPRKDVTKTALGAESSVPWTYDKHPAPRIARLRSLGWRIIGVEQDVRSLNYRTQRFDTDTLFILGNEVRGLSRPLRELCDALIEIPMRGKKESLNVSVAAGIVLFSAR